MDSLMIFWVFLIGLIAGMIVSLSLLYTVAIVPLRKKIDRLKQELDFYSKNNEGD